MLKSVERPVLYLCLGPLSNLSEALGLSSESKEKISTLIYFGGHPDDPSPGWNTQRDPEAARKVFASGLRVYSLNIPEDQWPRFDQRLCDQIRALRTPAAQFIVRLHEKAQVKTLLARGHFGIWDEAAVLYLRNPSTFLFKPKAGSPLVMDLVHVDRDSLEDLYLNSLGSGADLHLSPRTAVLLKAFPTNPLEFKADVAVHAQRIIGRHGLEEWKACLLTSELHRHLGTYSLIGAKMGIRAREILNAPFDTLKVVSYAGMAPPLSCMNDGLQVSTGASLGRGAIDISREGKEPKAVFIYGQERISLALKPFWTEKIKGDMRAAVNTYGEGGPAYFDHVRSLSIQYWFELDRDAIFDVEIPFTGPAEASEISGIATLPVGRSD